MSFLLHVKFYIQSVYTCSSIVLSITVLLLIGTYPLTTITFVLVEIFPFQTVL